VEGQVRASRRIPLVLQDQYWSLGPGGMALSAIVFWLEGFRKKGLFPEIDSEHLYKLQNHMVTPEEDVDGPRGS
jgi:hypothetical protein